MLRTTLAVFAFATLGACASMPPTKVIENAPDDEAWARYFPWNSATPEVKKTGTGLEYVVLASGPAGGEMVGPNGQAEIQYEVRLNKAGSEPFDSSFMDKDPVIFPVHDVIPGFEEAMTRMKPGDSWMVFIPSALGYGEEGAEGIVPPNSDLVFEIEMKRAINPPPSDAAAWSKFAPWDATKPEVKKTASGLQYVVIASGPAGGAPPTKEDDAEVFYEGRLASGGDAFDSAFERGGSETFPVAAVVPGFSEALQLMKPGDRWLVFIPSALGYGARGAGRDIPPNSDLIFEILMVGVP